MTKAGDFSMHHLEKKDRFECVRIEMCTVSPFVMLMCMRLLLCTLEHSIFGNATREYSEGGNQNVYKLLNLMRLSRVTIFCHPFHFKRKSNVSSVFCSIVLFKLSSKNYSKSRCVFRFELINRGETRKRKMCVPHWKCWFVCSKMCAD